MIESRINIDSCKSCGLCIVFCPRGSLRFSEEINARGVHFVVSRDPGSCNGCGICYQMCPDAAIEVVDPETEKCCI